MNRDVTEGLHHASRINMGQVYTVQHNVPVRFLGMISQTDLERLQARVQQNFAKRTANQHRQRGTHTAEDLDLENIEEMQDDLYDDADVDDGYEPEK
jgi:hypothetical protein